VASVENMSSIAPSDFEKTFFEVSPSVRILRFNYEVLPLWKALESGEPVGPVIQKENTAVVWRRELSVFHAAISSEECSALESAIQKQNLLNICECFSVPNDAFEAIASWFHERMVAEVLGQKL